MQSEIHIEYIVFKSIKVLLHEEDYCSQSSCNMHKRYNGPAMSAPARVMDALHVFRIGFSSSWVEGLAIIIFGTLDGPAITILCNNLATSYWCVFPISVTFISGTAAFHETHNY